MHSSAVGTSLLILGLTGFSYCITLCLFPNHPNVETRAAKVAVGVAAVFTTAVAIDYKNGNL